jgi:glycine/D-amino acid oxidase-like deaminating enzyme
MIAMTEHAHTAPVIIIGGGLHGSSTALHLARAGVHALVLEKNYIARHASGVNAGGVRTLSRHLAEVPLSLASREIWLKIRDWVDDDCGFDQNGQMRVAEDEAEKAEDIAEGEVAEEMPAEETIVEESAPRSVPRSTREKEIELAKRALK